MTTNIFATTINIDCCRTTILGDTCGTGTPELDTFGGFYPYQTVFLVITNIILFVPAYKAFLLYNYSRFFLLGMAAIFSSMYHICKTTGTDGGGGVCLIKFCTLKVLDFSFSTTLLMSIILFVFPFNPSVVEDEPQEDRRSNLEFIESYILCSFFLFILISFQSTELFCSGRRAYIIFGIVSGVVAILCLIGYCTIKHQGIQGRFYQKYNWTNVIIGAIFAVTAISIFVAEDFIPETSYWITHSLWHTLGGIAIIFFLDARNKKRTGISSCMFCRNNIKE